MAIREISLRPVSLESVYLQALKYQFTKVEAVMNLGRPILPGNIDVYHSPVEHNKVPAVYIVAGFGEPNDYQRVGKGFLIAFSSVEQLMPGSWPDSAERRFELAKGVDPIDHLYSFTYNKNSIGHDDSMQLPEKTSARRLNPFKRKPLYPIPLTLMKAENPSQYTIIVKSKVCSVAPISCSRII